MKLRHAMFTMGAPLLLSLAPAALAGTLYSNNFESGTTGITGAGGTTSTGNVNGDVTVNGNTVWWNTSGGDPAAATTLTLSGLAANQTLNLEFTFLAIASWDGSGLEGNCCAPDFMNVNLNSSSVFQGSFRNYNVGTDPEYPGHIVANGYPAPPANTTVTLLSSCCNGGGFGTSVYDISITGLTADALGNATFDFFASGSGWQGGGDESVGLDNIVVTSNASATPEPSSVFLLIGGAGIILGRIRRK